MFWCHIYTITTKKIRSLSVPAEIYCRNNWSELLARRAVAWSSSKVTEPGMVKTPKIKPRLCCALPLRPRAMPTRPIVRALSVIPFRLIPKYLCSNTIDVEALVVRPIETGYSPCRAAHFANRSLLTRPRGSWLKRVSRKQNRMDNRWTTQVKVWSSRDRKSDWEVRTHWGQRMDWADTFWSRQKSSRRSPCPVWGYRWLVTMTNIAYVSYFLLLQTKNAAEGTGLQSW